MMIVIVRLHRLTLSFQLRSNPPHELFLPFGEFVEAPLQPLQPIRPVRHRGPFTRDLGRNIPGQQAKNEDED
jgi:hypothetical protein